MSTLAHLLGLTGGDRVLILGHGDLELESAIVLGTGKAVERSLDGLDVPEASYDAVVLGREAATDRSRKRALAAAARALKPRGILAAEFPRRLPILGATLLAYEGVTEAPGPGPGVSRGEVRRLLTAAGLTRAASFLSLPSLADPRVVLPLDSRKALAFHFHRPFFAESGRRRLIRHLFALAARLGLFPHLCPALTVIASRGAARPSGQAARDARLGEGMGMGKAKGNGNGPPPRPRPGAAT